MPASPKFSLLAQCPAVKGVLSPSIFQHVIFPIDLSIPLDLLLNNQQPKSAWQHTFPFSSLRFDGAFIQAAALVHCCWPLMENLRPTTSVAHYRLEYYLPVWSQRRRTLISVVGGGGGATAPQDQTAARAGIQQDAETNVLSVLMEENCLYCTTPASWPRWVELSWVELKQ